MNSTRTLSYKTFSYRMRSYKDLQLQRLSATKTFSYIRLSGISTFGNKSFQLQRTFSYIRLSATQTFSYIGRPRWYDMLFWSVHNKVGYVTGVDYYLLTL